MYCRLMWSRTVMRCAGTSVIAGYDVGSDSWWPTDARRRYPCSETACEVALARIIRLIRVCTKAPKYEKGCFSCPVSASKETNSATSAIQRQRSRLQYVAPGRATIQSSAVGHNVIALVKLGRRRLQPLRILFSCVGTKMPRSVLPYFSVTRTTTTVAAVFAGRCRHI